MITKTKGFFHSGTYDVFIAHGWRYDTPWTNFVALLDNGLPGIWRNWSIPWHDPSIERQSQRGRSLIDEMLLGQVTNSQFLFVLRDMLTVGNDRTDWIRRQANLARTLKKPIFGVQGENGEIFPGEFSDLVDAELQYDSKAIVAAIRALVPEPEIRSELKS